MAKLYITELANLGSSESGAVPQVAQLPGVTTQVVAIGGASAQSAALNGATKFVRVACDTPCNIAVGDNPTATVNSHYLPAGAVEYLGVNARSKIAVIQGA